MNYKEESENLKKNSSKSRNKKLKQNTENCKTEGRRINERRQRQQQQQIVSASCGLFYDGEQLDYAKSVLARLARSDITGGQLHAQNKTKIRFSRS